MINLKKEAALEAAKYIEDGMIVGLGTGSTAYFFIEEMGRRVQEEGLNIIGVPTSFRSEEQGKSLGIPISTVNEVPYIDITVDGADEFDDSLNGIKGGGAAHLFEKIVAAQTKKNIWIVDESKHVEVLGKFPLPVEVIPFGSQPLYDLFERKGYNPSWRMDGDTKRLTDSKNYIIDLHMNAIEDSYKLAAYLDSLTGVVEHGLFLDIAKVVIVAKASGIEVIER